LAQAVVDPAVQVNQVDASPYQFDGRQEALALQALRGMRVF